LSHIDVRSHALASWASLSQVARLRRLQVLVRPSSPLCPSGWVGILGLLDTVTVAVPHRALTAPLEAAFAEVPVALATRPELVGDLFGTSAEVLGPAALFFAGEPSAVTPLRDVVVLSVADIQELLVSAADEEVRESGLPEVDSPVFATRDDHGSVVAACGYRRWPAGLAHMSVLTHPQHRCRGLARSVASAAIANALREGLLPQWRARPAPSKALARSLGLAQLGEQLSFRIQSPGPSDAARA
jgi:GNAT superfamily N-acetyltransferase